MKDMTPEQRKLVYRLAGGNLPAEQTIRSAAHRILVGCASEQDYKLIMEYIKDE